MAEYKNGVNAFGNMSVNTKDVSEAVDTGRNVYYSSKKYEADAAYKAKIDKYVAEGFQLVDTCATDDSDDPLDPQ